MSHGPLSGYTVIDASRVRAGRDVKNLALALQNLSATDVSEVRAETGDVLPLGLELDVAQLAADGRLPGGNLPQHHACREGGGRGWGRVNRIWPQGGSKEGLEIWPEGVVAGVEIGPRQRMCGRRPRSGCSRPCGACRGALARAHGSHERT